MFQAVSNGPSNTLGSTFGESFDVVSFVGRQSRRSRFSPVLISPSFESAGGIGWFSCLKNSSTSPSLVWLAIYNLEKRALSFLSPGSLPAPLGLSTPGLLKTGRLLRGIVSLKDLEPDLKRSLMKVSYLVTPVAYMLSMAFTTFSGITTLEFRLSKSPLSSMKRLPISSSVMTRERTSLTNLSWTLFVCSSMRC